MITSNQIISILDQYSGGYKLGHDFITIFVNPSSKEILDASIDQFDKANSGTVRFFADGKHPKVYVWGSRFLHSEASSKIGFNNRFDNNDPSIFLGVAKVSGGKAKIDDSYNLTWRIETAKNGNKESINFLKSFFSIKWDWVNTYIDCRNFLKDREQEFRTRK